MQSDHEVAVIHHQSLSEPEIINDYTSCPSTTNSFTGGDKANNIETIQQDFEFIRKHATNIDLDFLHSLLVAESNNPRRLETVMCDELNIPNAAELIKSFRSNTAKHSEKRASKETLFQTTDSKKAKNELRKDYLSQMQDMFPDANSQFLSNECQYIKNEEEFSRFLNTVMINGVYPKENLANNSVSTVIDITNDTNITDLIDITESNDSTQSYNLPDDNLLSVLYTDAAFIQTPNKEYTFGKNKDLSIESNINRDIERKATSIETPSLSCKNQVERSYESLDENKSLAEIIEEKRSKRASPSSFKVECSPEPSTSKEINLNFDSPMVSEYEDGEPALEGDKMNVEEIKWLEEQTANLIRIFPNTDPSFLREEAVKMNMSFEAMNAFVVAKLERNDMPSRADYEKKREMEMLQNRYTKNFSIPDFLKAIPDPWKHFAEANRNCEKYKNHSLCYLRATFRKHYIRDIQKIFKDNNYNLYLSYKALKKFPAIMRGARRSEFECNVNRPTTIDIQFLQELAFIENEEKIEKYLKNEKELRKMKFEEAKLTGSLLECQCCFDSEVMVEDIVYCPKDHAFCKSCVIKSVEVEMGNGMCQFGCLTSCGEKFTLACLQSVLQPELFSKIIQTIQMEEIRAADIDDLVQCPFCTYATIMPPEEKIMTCLNPECLKESCRLCKELNHIPLKCSEVEKSEDIKLRTYIENKMTEALVRICYKCGKKFVKEDGCNKMTCTCGAKMCYICRQPVSDYSHFNGQGGTEYHKCPLYSTNDELHVDLVQKVGEEAKAKIMRANPTGRLLHDPTVIPPKRTHDRVMPGMNNREAIIRERRTIRELLGEPGEEEVDYENEDDDDYFPDRDYKENYDSYDDDYDDDDEPFSETESEDDIEENNEIRQANVHRGHCKRKHQTKNKNENDEIGNAACRKRHRKVENAPQPRSRHKRKHEEGDGNDLEILEHRRNHLRRHSRHHIHRNHQPHHDHH